MLLRSPDENSEVSTGLDNMEATSDRQNLWSGQVGMGARLKLEEVEAVCADNSEFQVVWPGERAEMEQELKEKVKLQADSSKMIGKKACPYSAKNDPKVKSLR